MEKRNYPWFLVSGRTDGRWWWDNIAGSAMRREWQELMHECDEWRNSPGASHDNEASILAAWSVDDTVGASATVTLTDRDDYITDEDGPCVWDRSSGSPPPWWSDGMPSEIVRRISRMSARIARDYHDWTYGPARREYYSRAIG